MRQYLYFCTSKGSKVSTWLQQGERQGGERLAYNVAVHVSKGIVEALYTRSTHGYVDERLLSREGEGTKVIGVRLRDKTVPWQVQRRRCLTRSRVELTYIEWVSVEATVAPCANGLGSKVEKINTKGSDRLTLKHFATYKVRVVRSKRERLRRKTRIPLMRIRVI